MPRNLFQEIVFTLIMVVVMVYAMVCYNVALDMGGMRNEIFVIAFSELPMMGGIAFVLELFVVGPLAKRLAFRIVDPRRHAPIFITLAISALTVCFMCPLMSLAATLIIKQPGGEWFAVWIQTSALNFPMALCSFSLYMKTCRWRVSMASVMVLRSWGIPIEPRLPRTVSKAALATSAKKISVCSIGMV